MRKRAVSCGFRSTISYGPEPTGYDHRHLVTLPEYHEARAAVDRLLNAMPSGSWQGAYTLLREMAATAYAGDVCDRCALADPDVESSYAPRYPIRVVPEESGICCSYLCRTCGHGWTSWWTDDPSLLT